VRVTIVLNMEVGHWGRPYSEAAYQDGDAVQAVFAFDAPQEVAAAGAEAACEFAFAVCNSYPQEAFGVAREHLELVAAYRKRRNRSLSVGDVVVVGEVAYCCDRFGWQRLERPPVLEGAAG